jgi:predicted helicase
VQRFASIGNEEIQLKTLNPNVHGDWISQRNHLFSTLISLESEKKNDIRSKSFFIAKSLGTVTARDSWVYNFSKVTLRLNIQKTIAHYNSERDLVATRIHDSPKADSKLGSWSRDWLNNLKRNKVIIENIKEYKTTFYRPFIKVNSYFDDDLNQERYQLPKLFTPIKGFENLVIVLTGVGAAKSFSTLIVNSIPNYDFIEKSTCFPLFYFEERQKQSRGLFDTDEGDSEYIRRDGVSDFILERAKAMYGKTVGKEDIFYYVYGFLHCPEYKEKFANDLKKMLPRLPLVEDVKDFWKFSKAGRALAELHINYETVLPYEGVKVTGADSGFYKVEKLRFPKKDQKYTIIFNSKIIIENIPAKAYDYVVNGKSAIEWIMERYQITTHKESGIKNDPNDWAADVGNPRYILDLLLSIINVSVKTVDIVSILPKVSFE